MPAQRREDPMTPGASATVEVAWFNLICVGVDRRAHHGIAYTVISVPCLSALPILPNAAENALEGEMGIPHLPFDEEICAVP